MQVSSNDTCQNMKVVKYEIEFHSAGKQQQDFLYLYIPLDICRYKLVGRSYLFVC